MAVSRHTRKGQTRKHINRTNRKGKGYIHSVTLKRG